MHVYEMINNLLAAAMHVIICKEIVVTKKFVIRLSNKWVSWTRFPIAIYFVYLAIGMSMFSQTVWMTIEFHMGIGGVIGIFARMIVTIVWQKFKKKISFMQSIRQYIGWWVADAKELFKIILRSIRSDFPSMEVE